MAEKQKIQAGRIRVCVSPDTDPPVKMYVKMRQRQLNAFNDKLKALQASESDTATLDVSALMAGFLAEVVVDWENVLREDGEPAKPTVEDLDEFDPQDIITLFQTLQNIGEAGTGNPTTETPSGDSSEEPPAS